MSNVKNSVSPYMDMVLSHLRQQVSGLNSILDTIERTHDYEDDYVKESIKGIEKELHRLRKFIR